MTGEVLQDSIIMLENDHQVLLVASHSKGRSVLLRNMLEDIRTINNLTTIMSYQAAITHSPIYTQQPC